MCSGSTGGGVSVCLPQNNMPVLVRARAKAADVQHPTLPAYMDGHIELFDYNESDAGHLVKLLEELRLEYAREHCGFWDVRKGIIEAWNEHRLFGLRIDNSYEFYESNKKRGGDDDKYLMPLNGAFVLPVYCAVDRPCPAEGGSINECLNESIIEELWVAERVRGAGIGRRIVAEINARGVKDPASDAEKFWQKMGYGPVTHTKKRNRHGHTSI